MDKMVPQRAAAEVVFFQKSPKIKMAVMPGLIIPVYSWMNWKAWSMLPSNGATTTAIAIAKIPEILPTATSCFSEAFGLICGLYRSMVKMVDVLLMMALKEETMAAIRAANRS